MERARLLRTIGILGAFGLLALALYFRFHASLVEPFWLDEAYSAYAAGKGFGFLWHVVATYETHPPFYYSLLRCWTLLFGDSLAGHRSLGYVAGVAVLPVIWLGARDSGRLAGLDPRRIAWGATAFAAVSIALVAMTREVRPYPVMILVYAGTLWALVRLGIAAERGRGVAGRPFAGYLVGLALMLWLHNLGVLYAAAIGLAFAALVLRARLSRRDWVRIVSGHLLVLLAWLPALAILADQAPTWVRATWLTFSWATVPGKLAILYAAPGFAPGVALFVLAGLAIWRLMERAPARRLAAALFALALVPPGLSIALSAMVAPVFIMRTMTPVAVPAMLLLSIGTIGWAAGWRRHVGLTAGLVVAFHMILVDVRERQHVGGQQDWYGVVRFLAPRWQPGDVLLAYPNEGALPLVFALRDRGVTIPVRPVPTPVPSIGVGGWYPTGSRGVVSLPRDRLRAIAREPAVQAARTVWLLRLGPRAYDKGDMFLRELSVGRRPVARLYWNPINLIALRRAEKS
ncbi:glycosyltransferase family 39 protein [Sphingomonas montana]|uniref:glycosyltransferase family 39 protein n=1 Tax=Sphingomonas montana TaxID=1843236 RepID=UPI00096D5E65|nr:glycosyltransferase family 39 protein [Sphingomonas montana]